VNEQPAPIPNEWPAVWDLVIADMQARDSVGRQRYGTRLQPHNGRDALRDAYEEVLDLAVYLRQEIEERKAAQAVPTKNVSSSVGTVTQTCPLCEKCGNYRQGFCEYCKPKPVEQSAAAVTISEPCS
jgi:hypothetical protein